MKKITVLLIAIILALTFAACKKTDAIDRGQIAADIESLQEESANVSGEEALKTEAEEGTLTLEEAKAARIEKLKEGMEEN